MDQKIIYRSDEPTKQDTADYLTICLAKKFEYFIQLSKDPENPKWESVGCCPENITYTISKLIDLLK